MIQYNLTNTRFMNDEALSLPSEGEMLAILVALMAINGLSFQDLELHTLRLADDRCDEVARWLDENLPVFVSEFGTRRTRDRLKELVGIEISILAERRCERTTAS